METAQHEKCAGKKRLAAAQYYVCFVVLCALKVCKEQQQQHGEGEKDKKKLLFTFEALAAKDPFEHNVCQLIIFCVISCTTCAWQAELPKDAEQALQWQTGLSDDEIMRDRERILNTLEDAAKVMWQEGLCQKWLEGADPQVAVVSKTVNGIIMEDLAKAIGHEDLEIVEVFRIGGELMGPLQVSGREVQKKAPVGCANPADLLSDCGRSNKALLDKLKADDYEDELHRLTVEDAKLGRMSWPVPAEECVRSELN